MANQRKKKGPLSPFDGKDVRAATISVTNAGDGLSKALAVEPTEMHHGEKIYVVLECEVTKVRFDPIKDSPDDLVRVHILKAGDATIVDEDLVSEQLDEQRKRIEQAAGIERLPFSGGDEDGSGEEPAGA